MTQNHNTKTKHLKKMSRSQIIKSLIVLCCLLAGVAVFLFINIQQEGELAGQRAKKLLEASETKLTLDATASPSLQPVLSGLTEYPVMAKLTIPKFELELPVISEYSDEALKVSVCRYMGPSKPSEAGNLVIIGHDYRSGAHFGRIDELKSGDIIVLTDTLGKEYTFEVYELTQILPDDFELLNIYEGTSAVTLLTCTDNANKRLLVRCKLVAHP